MSTLLCLIGLGLAAPPDRPLHCPEPVAAKGEVKGGPVLVHTFVLTNRGGGPITITRVEASCGCLRRTLSRDVLQVAETTNLTLEVNTLTQPNGPNRWQVLLGYKLEAPGVPPQIGEVSLQVTANLLQEVIVSPPQLAFSTASGATQILTITDRRPNPLNIVKVSTTSQHLVAEAGVRKSGLDGGSRQEVTIKLSADIPAGRTDETVVLTTTDPAYPELRIPVQVEKRAAGGLEVVPESVTVRFGSDSTEVATLVRLRRTDGKPLTISTAVSDNPGVTVKASSGAASIAAVRVTVSGNHAVQPGSGTVKVKLEDGQELMIPVRWMPQAK